MCHGHAGRHADPDPGRPARRSTAAAIRSRRRVGDRVRRRGDHLPRRARVLRAVVRYRRGRNAPLARGAARSRSATTAGRAASRRTALGRWSSRSRRGSTAYATLARRARPQGRRRPGRPRGRAVGGSGAVRPRHRRGVACSAPTSSARAERREAVTSPAFEVDVERERARFGAWYELFPRSWGGFARRRARAAGARRARLRRRLPPADPPDRADEPQGPQQRRRGRARATRAARGRSAPRRAATTRSHPELGTRRRLRRARRSGRRGRASSSRSTSRSSARPTTRG